MSRGRVNVALIRSTISKNATRALRKRTRALGDDWRMEEER